jgi:hypothetical protein
MPQHVIDGAIPEAPNDLNASEEPEVTPREEV